MLKRGSKRGAGREGGSRAGDVDEEFKSALHMTTEPTRGILSRITYERSGVVHLSNPTLSVSLYAIPAMATSQLATTSVY